MLRFAHIIINARLGVVSVKSLPVRCRFRFSPPDRASRLSRRFATIKVPFPSPTTLTAVDVLRFPLLLIILVAPATIA
jgi:hypothetical protein